GRSVPGQGLRHADAQGDPARRHAGTRARGRLGAGRAARQPGPARRGARRPGGTGPGARAPAGPPAAGHTRVPSPRSASWVLADRLARSTNVDAKPITSRASASHGAQIVGLVTL